MTAAPLLLPRAAASGSFDNWRIKCLVIALLGVTVAMAALSGFMRGAENRIHDLAFTVFNRAASGQVHVVEMDAASMAAIRSWPWQREHYAAALRQLDAAGVRSISFDVDFSSNGNPAGDRAFAQAIADANAAIVLPTFGQAADFGDGRKLDSLPIPELREHAQLASVSVAPGPDGYVRTMPLGTITDAVARPSISALIAGEAGSAGESLPINFAVDPATLARHSFIAIEKGLFDPALLRGKDVIIGATAVELGDRYAVPRFGVIPGVIIHALAAETLLGARPVTGTWAIPLLVAALLSYGLLGARRRRAVLIRTLAAAVVLVSGWIAARIGLAIWTEITPALAMVMGAGAVRYIVLTRRFAAQARQRDPESGLPNRLAFKARAAVASDRYVVAAQIDDFDALKLAIDHVGLGDLLRRTAERLQVAGGGSGVVYRSEDRTLVWFSALPIDELQAHLAGLRAVMRSPFDIAGRRLGVSLTFGVADCTIADPDSHAAHAAASAKRAGKLWRLHTQEAGAAINLELDLLSELDEALRSGNIAVLYQPKLNLVTRRIDSVEALVRWNHPKRGLLPPDCFIPLFEERGRLDELTLAVLEQAMDDAKRWQSDGLHIAIAVNISAAVLTSENFETRALARIAHSGLPAEQVTFEVTESAHFEDTAEAIAMLERFRAAGIRISMDDYGTGQSALNYLKLLPLSELKIDRMFVAQVHTDRGDAMLVRSTVQLAHELGLKVVAEGIEEAACLDFLTEIGCDHAQGYFVGRPLAANDLAALAAATLPASQPPPLVSAA